jgi:hypothetical protein
MKQMRVSKAVLKAITLSSMLALGGTYASATEHTNPEPSEATTSLQGKLNLSENGGFDPDPPSDLNKKTDIRNSYFGISYVPATFDFSSVKLEDTVGSQTINALKSKNTEESRTSEKTFNIGVKDKRRVSTNDWTLFAKLNSEIGEDAEGMTISIDSKTNEVKRNMNDGKEAFQEDDLVDQVKKSGKKEVAKMDSVTLTQENKPVMYTTGEQFVNGVYDLELENVSLTIPDASKAKAQNISTSIQWTLESTPMKPSYLINEVKILFKDAQCKKLKTDELNYSMVQGAVEAVKGIQDPDQKKYNEKYLQDYVLDSYAEWTLRGVKNISTHTFGKMQFFRSPDEQKAALTLNKENIQPHAGYYDEKYFSLVVMRKDNTVLSQSFSGTNTSTFNKTIELFPGDTIGVYHREGTSDRLVVKPDAFKGSPIERQYEEFKIRLTYEVTEDLKLELKSRVIGEQATSE